MPNKQSIYNYIDNLKEILERLVKFRAHSLEDFQKKDDLQWALDRGIQLAVQCCIDIGDEIITGLNFRKPMNYQEIFDVLLQHNIIEIELANKLKQLVRYRNELVHEYWRLDIKENYRILNEDISFFEQYLAKIGALLK